MSDGPPSSWEREEDRTYTPRHASGSRRYRTYVHESGDLRLKVAPATIDDGEPGSGYVLTAIPYPGLDRETHPVDLPERVPITQALRFERCDELATRFMSLFDGVYDGAGTLEDALVFGLERTGPHTTVETSLPPSLERETEGEEEL